MLRLGEQRWLQAPDLSHSILKSRPPFVSALFFIYVMKRSVPNRFMLIRFTHDSHSRKDIKIIKSKRSNINNMLCNENVSKNLVYKTDVLIFFLSLSIVEWNFESRNEQKYIITVVIGEKIKSKISIRTKVIAFLSNIPGTPDKQ